MSDNIAYCTGCKVLQVDPELAANMDKPELPKWSYMRFVAYCAVCKCNKEFKWTELKTDPNL